MGELTVAVDCDLDTGVATVTFAGELDVPAAATVRAALARALDDCPVAVIVDLRRAVPTDPAALNVFRNVARAPANGPEAALVLVGPPERIEPGVGDLPVCPDLGAALETVARGAALLRRLSLRLPPDGRSASTARRFVLATCAAWGLSDLADSAELIASELVSNAISHARTEFDLTATLHESYLHLSVRDGSRAQPVLPPPTGPDWESLALSGRGLQLVAACASGWGWVVGTDGKIVWATLKAN